MKNQVAAIYLRLSDEDWNKEEGDASESIKNQRQLLMTYAADNDWNIFDIYSDDDWSGLDAQRPDWNRMLADAEQKKFDIVLCKSQARFSRDMEIIEKYLHKWFPIWGIRFVGLADNADTLNKGNKKQRQINGLINEWYCEDISENVRIVFDQKRKDGQYIGSFPVYGYQKDPEKKGHLIPDPEAATVVKRIFNMYIDGRGSSIITQILNNEKIPNPTKYKENKGIQWKGKDHLGLWNRTTVKRILKNQMYLGHMVQGVSKKLSYKDKKKVSVPRKQWIIVSNMHEAIINQETFDLAQEIMGSRRKTDGKGTPHVLAGKVFCADCGSRMIRITPHNRKNRPFPYKYLKCGMAEKQRGRCSGHYIRLDRLEELVLERMRLYLKEIDSQLIQDGLKKDNINNVASNLKKEKNKNEIVLKQMAEALQTLYLDKTSGLLSASDFAVLSSGFSDKRQTAQNRIADIENELSKIKGFHNQEEIIRNKIKAFQEVEHLTPRIVQEFVEKILIFEKDKETGHQEIQIFWRY